MSQLALNLLLAIVWTFLAGSFTFRSLLFGFVLGYLALALLRPSTSTQIYVRSLWGIGRLVLIYAYELTIASIQLARDSFASTRRSCRPPRPWCSRTCSRSHPGP
jgi:multicomponent Na+:H+ antiporter subunit E